MSAESDVWNCAVCTFENVSTFSACEICGSPRPKAERPKHQESGGSPSDSSSMLHDLIALVAACRTFTQETPIEENPAVLALFRYALQDLIHDSPHERIILIENLPEASRDEQKSFLSRLFRSIDPTIRLNPAEFYLGQNPLKSSVAVPEFDPVAALQDAKSPELGNRPFKTEFGEEGILYRLGKLAFARSKAASGSSSSDDKSKDKDWLNPAQHCGIVTVTSSGTDSASCAHHDLLSRSPVRFSTKLVQKSWVTIEFASHEAAITHYSIRNGDGNDWKRESLRSWKFEASKDGKKWVTLDEQNKNGCFSSKESAVSFPVSSPSSGSENWSSYAGSFGPEDYFSQFRLSITNQNSGSNWNLCLGGIELFGDLKKRVERPQPSETPNFAAVALMNSDKKKLDELLKQLNTQETKLWLKLPIVEPEESVVEVKESKEESKSEKEDEKEKEKNEKARKDKKEGEDMRRAFLEAHTVQLKARKFIELEDSDPLRSLIMHLKLIAAPEETMKPSAALRDAMKTLASLHGASAANSHRIPPNSVHSMFGLVSQPPEFAAQFKLFLQKADDEKGVTPDEMAHFLLSLAYSNGRVIGSGVQFIYSFLSACGFDFNLTHHRFLSDEEALHSQRPNIWSRHTASPFMKFLVSVSDRCGESSLLALKPSQIQPQDSDFTFLGPALSELPLPALRLRFAILKKFNTLFEAMLALIDLRHATSQRDSISGLVFQAKSFIFPSIKFTFLNRILDSTSEECKPPQIQVNRLHLSHLKQRHEVIDFSTQTIFGIAMTQLADRDPFSLRPQRPQGTEPFLAFEIQFLGEHVVGSGGPFRQFFSDVAKELQDSSSPLFLPCPNKLSGLGENREKFVLSPSANHGQALQQLEFLGMLFGVCFRTGVRFPLELPAFFWKQLVDEQLEISDLIAIDKGFVDSLRFIASCDEETFNDSIGSRFFTTDLSDKSTVELKENGADTRVTFANRMEYLNLSFAARLCECSAQVDAIKRGLGKIIPIQLLSLLTPSEAELQVCGRPYIDIELLRQHTTYAAGVDPEAQHIEWFWKILNEYDQHHRRLFIRFAWAQERLPADEAEFERSRTRLLIKPGPKDDQRLMRSDTCFFNLELPVYSSESVMRSKLLYAITSDSTMNADRDVDVWGRRGDRGQRDEDEDY